MEVLKVAGYLRIMKLFILPFWDQTERGVEELFAIFSSILDHQIAKIILRRSQTMDVNVQECKEIFSSFKVSVALSMYRQK